MYPIFSTQNILGTSLHRGFFTAPAVASLATGNLDRT
jgi:hypothetical protein